jgi:hypothetical protein
MIVPASNRGKHAHLIRRRLCRPRLPPIARIPAPLLSGTEALERDAANDDVIHWTNIPFPLQDCRTEPRPPVASIVNPLTVQMAQST